MHRSLAKLLSTISQEDDTETVVVTDEVKIENPSDEVMVNEEPIDEDVLVDSIAALESFRDSIQDIKGDLSDTAKRLYHLNMSQILKPLNIPMSRCVGMESLSTGEDIQQYTQKWIDGLTASLKQ